MSHPFKSRHIAVVATGILAVAAALWCYWFLASFMPTTIFIDASIFVPLATLVYICIYRVTGWKAIGTWRRVYAAATLGISSSLLVGFMVLVAQDEMFAPKYLWAVWNIKRLDGHVQIEELRGRDVWVSLNGPRVNDAGLAYLEAFPRLRSLHLLDTKITDAGLQHLKGLNHLRFLHLDFNNVTDDGLLYLGGLTNLIELTLSGTKVGDVGLERVKGLTQLYILRLEGTRVTDAGLAHLATLTKLKWLNLQGTRVTDTGEKKLRQALPKCTIER